MPDMREKVIEYINKLDFEITRVEQWISSNLKDEISEMASMIGRLNALTEVKCDLQNRLEESI